MSDLSFPSGTGVNDGILSNLCPLQYSMVDDAHPKTKPWITACIKLEIKDAYRIEPVHPDDYHLLGLKWGSSTYMDRALPFGLWSAPNIFNAIVDIIAWVLNCLGIQHQLHYLDDFLFIGALDLQQGWEYLVKALHILEKLGVPVAAHKT